MDCGEKSGLTNKTVLSVVLKITTGLIYSLSHLTIVEFWLRLRESYKRFLKTMDLFHNVVTNPNSKKVRAVSYEMNPGFVLYHGSQIWTYNDLFQIVNHKSSQFSKIPPVFTNPANPHESSQILSTIAQNESLKIWNRKFWILTNPDLRVQTLKVCIAD